MLMVSKALLQRCLQLLLLGRLVTAPEGVVCVMQNVGSSTWG